VRAGAERGGVRLSICQQAAAGYIALLAARALKRRSSKIDSLEKEFAELPGRIEWAFTQQGEGLRSLASELAGATSVMVLGGGSYHSPAVMVAALLSRLAGIPAGGMNVTEASALRERLAGRGATLLVLTGSHCGARKQVQAAVEGASRAGTKILSLTDGNDPEVSRRSALTLLLPPLSELTGSTLAHAVMAWTAQHAGRAASRPTTPRRVPRRD